MIFVTALEHMSCDGVVAAGVVGNGLGALGQPAKVLVMVLLIPVQVKDAEDAVEQ